MPCTPAAMTTPNSLTSTAVCRQLGISSLCDIVPSPVRFEKGAAWKYLIKRTWNHCRVENESRRNFGEAGAPRPERWSFPASLPETEEQDIACFLGIAGGNPRMAPTSVPALAAGQHDPRLLAYKFVPGLYADFYDDAWEIDGCPHVATTFRVSLSILNNSVGQG